LSDVAGSGAHAASAKAANAPSKIVLIIRMSLCDATCAP